MYKGEILDILDYQAEYGINDERIVQNNSKIVERIISEGENEQIEFKQEYNKSNKHEFFETVVSFSNTRGGTILLGITDKCQIKGLEKPLDDKDSIEDDLNKFCRPRLDDATVKIIKMANDREIISIFIPEDKEKPYFLIDSNRDEKAYIRKGSSDRKMKREEFERIYQERDSNQGTFRFYG